MARASRRSAGIAPPGAQIRARLVQEHPTDSQHKRDLANSHDNIGISLGDTGRLAKRWIHTGGSWKFASGSCRRTPPTASF